MYFSIKFFIAITAGFLLIQQSCTYKKEAPQPQNDCISDETISFSQDIESIFSGTCAIPDCHDDNSAAAPGNFTTHQGITAKLEPGDASNSLIWQRVSNDEMPPDHSPGPDLSECDKKKIKNWIDQGAENN